MKAERRSDALFLGRADNEIVSAPRKFPADVTLSTRAKVHANVHRRGERTSSDTSMCPPTVQSGHIEPETTPNDSSATSLAAAMIGSRQIQF